MRLLCLSGSLREQSSSSAVVRTIREMVRDEAETITFDIGELPLYNADLTPDIVDRFKATIADADGLVIVTPEYNYSMPGVLKNAIDWASRPGYNSVFKDKPVFVTSVSGGALGGVRAQAHLKAVLNAMLARTFIWQEIAVAHAGTKIENGRLTDQVTVDFIAPAMEQFIATVRNQIRIAG